MTMSEVPELRFKGFDEPWEQYELQTLYSNAGSGGTPLSSIDEYYDGNIPFLSIADINGRYIDTTAKTISQKGLGSSAAWIVPTGSIALAMYASVGKTGILELDAATSQAFFNMIFASESTRNFVFSRLEKAEAEFEWEAYISTGTQRNLNAEKVKKWIILSPGPEEQQQIGGFFEILDALITLNQKKYDKLCNFKKAMLEKMFPKEGESVPEIRFEGFDKPWEERKLGEMLKESDERSSDQEILSVSAANGIYPASESDRDVNPGASLANYKVVHQGDIVYNSMRMWQGASGASEYNGIVSPAYVVMQPTPDIDSKMLAYSLKLSDSLSKFYYASQGNSKDTLTLKYPAFAEIITLVPNDLNEQHQISALFSKIDSLISNQQQKCETLNNFKKALLDKMFV